MPGASSGGHRRRCATICVENLRDPQYPSAESTRKIEILCHTLCRQSLGNGENHGDNPNQFGITAAIMRITILFAYEQNLISILAPEFQNVSIPYSSYEFPYIEQYFSEHYILYQASFF